MPATAERRRELSLLKRRRETPYDCWEWTGSVAISGYGQYRTEDGNLLVHRLAYEMYVGPLADNDIVHHRCLNPLCFNPEHLEVTTREEHPRIHASPVCISCGADDWYYRPNGWRRCRPCHTRAARLRARRRSPL